MVKTFFQMSAHVGNTSNFSRELFRFESASSILGWTAIDDIVMGGNSRSCLRYDAAGYAVFEGTVSLERNGGFASVRSPALDLGTPGAVTCVLKVCGDGKRYKLNLLTDELFGGVKYQCQFQSRFNQWTSIQLPLSAFLTTFRGQRVENTPPLNPGRLRQAGLLIADHQPGSFYLAIRSISLI